ncbi:hypothetical protein POVWA2_031040 [Plasmodium ovale wallikeri]|uniref:Uncharacterized protein n=1 Tax=Plasmodium ovale wallikeri TaxID=864142 RepID=A0A1A8YWX7_PLAOA|nr:hypothetical protein POVWA1_031320 [Plasmodium ovale wallikeri]SBT36614.1 hypothetical protein POVWA2_031040 [Plasmodium ovale wallikeri]
MSVFLHTSPQKGVAKRGWKLCCRPTAALQLPYRCSTAALPLLYRCLTAALPLLYRCFTAALPTPYCLP